MPGAIVERLLSNPVEGGSDTQRDGVADIFDGTGDIHSKRPVVPSKGKKGLRESKVRNDRWMQSMRHVAKALCKLVDHALQQLKICLQFKRELFAREREPFGVQANESGALGEIVMQLSGYAAALFFLGVE
ncbi:MAG TPA: hypothetical protein VFB43_06820 [Terracidiphilus sp.]|nr:hypothetical protein [Terracidiphilus sp.]